MEDEDKSSLTDHEIDVEDLEEEPLSKNNSIRINPAVKEVPIISDDDEEEEESSKNRNHHNHHNHKKMNKKSGKSGKSGSGGSGSSGSGSSTNPQVKPRCNCDQLRQADCHLETKELWDKFNELGTEMIITKTGRYNKEQTNHPSCS